MPFKSLSERVHAQWRLIREWVNIDALVVAHSNGLMPPGPQDSASLLPLTETLQPLRCQRPFNKRPDVRNLCNVDILQTLRRPASLAIVADGKLSGPRGEGGHAFPCCALDERLAREPYGDAAVSSRSAPRQRD